MPDAPPERRAIARAVTWRKAILTLISGQGGIIQATAIDISPDGLRVVSPIHLAIGQEVEVMLPSRPDHATEDPLAVSGRIVWTVAGPNSAHTAGIRLQEEAPPVADAASMTRSDAEALIARVRTELHAQAAAGKGTVIQLTSLSHDRTRGNRWKRGALLLLALLLLLFASYMVTRMIDWRPHGNAPETPRTLTSPEALNNAQEYLLAGNHLDATEHFEKLAADAPTPAMRLIAALGLADALREQGRLQEAKMAVLKGVEANPDAPKAWRELAEEFQRDLTEGGDLAAAPPLLMNALDLLPSPKEPQAAPAEEPLSPVTADTPPQPLNSAPPLPTPQTEEPPAPVRLEVDASDYVLSVFRGDSLVAAYAVGLGVENATPRGDFVIANKITNPDWYNRGETVKSGDPRNPLGALWMGLGNKKGATSYGIHPTREAESIGTNRSRGCVRMRPSDAAALFEICPLGTPVLIRE